MSTTSRRTWSKGSAGSRRRSPRRSGRLSSTASSIRPRNTFATCAPAIRRRCCSAPTASRSSSAAGGRSRSGSASAPIAAPTAELPAEAILLLYSDGAIERRGEPLDGGLSRLVEAAAGLEEHSVESACAELVEELFADREQEDDVALLAISLVREPVPRLALNEPASPERLAPMRAQLRAWLGRVGAQPDAVADVVLASAEALANAVEHAYADGLQGGTVLLEARLEPPREVVIRVSDEGTWRDQRSPRLDRGRGLMVMRALMDEVDVAPGATGTIVTLRRKLPDVGAAGVAARENYVAGP